MTPLVLNQTTRIGSPKKPTGIVTRKAMECNYPILIIVLQLGLNDVQPLTTHWDTLGIDFSSTAMLPPNHGASERSGSDASGYQVLPPEWGVDNVPRATPRKLHFPMMVVPPKLGAYSCPRIMFLDVWCTATPLDTWRRFSLLLIFLNDYWRILQAHRTIT
jgi:hypothetical protein